jgi:polyferredoxin
MEKARRLIQLIALFAANPWLLSSWRGGAPIYRGALKHLCFPGLNCYSCPAATMACPLGAIQNFITGFRMNLQAGLFHPGIYVAGSLGLVASFLGRAPCAWLCPFGLFQEVVYKLPVRKRDIWRPLRYGRHVMLVFFVLLLPFFLTDTAGYGVTWFCKFVCPAGTLEAGFPLLLLEPSLRDTLGLLFFHKVVVLALIISWSAVTLRPFCRTLCPLGLLLGFFNRASWLRLHFESAKCVECRVCTAICPAGVSFFDGRDDINSSHCIRCMRCLNFCPGASVRLSFSPVRKEFEYEKKENCACHREHGQGEGDDKPAGTL